MKQMKTLNDKLMRCLSLQNNFNSQLNQNWRTAKYAWTRAMWIEAGELADHLGYKWWKNVDAAPDREQMLLEVVDIFHFLLSDMMIVYNEKGTDLTNRIINSYNFATAHTKATSKEQKLSLIEDFVNDCVNGYPNVNSYFKVVVGTGFTLEDVVDYYLGKNALNLFRFDHGYRSGDYIKVWNGKEDNVILDEILKTGERDFDAIYKQLSERYQSFIMENQQ
jgi:dimeric dUTPase (all-alpha-NTP-PPase superfamily)